MKILIISNEYDHPKLPSSGGIGVFNKNYSKELVKLGHQVSILVLGISDLKFEDNGVMVQSFQSPLLKIQSLYNLFEKVVHKIGLSALIFPFLKWERKFFAKKIQNFISENNVDVIEASDFLGVGAFLEADKPFVIRYHGCYAMLHKLANFRKNDAFKKVEEIQIQKAKAHISVSDYSGEIHQEIFGFKSYNVVYNGLDINKMNPLFKPELKKDDVLLFFGKISDNKGIHEVIETYKLLLSQFPNLKLEMVGGISTEIDYEKDVIQKIEPKFRGQIIYHGRKSQTELFEIINYSTLALLPSKVENFPLTFIESMFFQTPVVMSENTPQLFEIFEKEKELWAAKTPFEMADKCSYILNNLPIIKTGSEKTRNKILNQLSMENTAKKSIEIYQKYLNS